MEAEMPKVSMWVSMRRSPSYSDGAVHSPAAYVLLGDIMFPQAMLVAICNEHRAGEFCRKYTYDVAAAMLAELRDLIATVVTRLFVQPIEITVDGVPERFEFPGDLCGANG